VIEQRIRHMAMVTRGQAVAEAKLTGIHEGLVAAGLVDWSSFAIPRSVAEPYVLIARVELGPMFGQQIAPDAIPAAEAQIKRVSTVRRAQTLAEGRVAVVHDGLVAQGNASWTASGIPQERCGRVRRAGGAVDLRRCWASRPTRWIAAEGRVRRMSRSAPGRRWRSRRCGRCMPTSRRAARRGGLIERRGSPYVYLAAYDLAPVVRRAAEPERPADGDGRPGRLIALPTSGERVRAEYY
jgi:hypothetical protein